MMALVILFKAKKNFLKKSLINNPIIKQRNALMETEYSMGIGKKKIIIWTKKITIKSNANMPRNKNT